MSFTQTINFDTAANFTFNSSLIEFSGSLARLKQSLPAASNLFAPLNLNLNAYYDDSSIAGTAINGASISGGKLVLGSSKALSFTAPAGIFFTNTGTVRFLLTPAYSGTPVGPLNIFSMSASDGSITNYLALYHSNTGQLALQWGAASVTAMFDVGAWSPVSGTEYEIELNFDPAHGATRIFIDGVQVGSTITDTTLRGSTVDFLMIGANTIQTPGSFYVGSYRAFTTFDTVQHTTNYTPGPIVLGIYDTSNPTLLPNSSLSLDDISSFTEVATKTGSDEVKYTIYFVNSGEDHYWTGTAWAVSDGSYAQANTAAEIEANLGSLDLSLGETIKIRTFLHSADGSTRPSITSIEFDYDFFQEAPDKPTLCVCYLRVIDLTDNEVATAKLLVSMDSMAVYETWFVMPFEKRKQANVNGYIEIALIETESISKPVNFSLTYVEEISQKTKTIRFKDAIIPNQTTKDLSTLLEVA